MTAFISYNKPKKNREKKIKYDSIWHTVNYLEQRQQLYYFLLNKQRIFQSSTNHHFYMLSKYLCFCCVFLMVVSQLVANIHSPYDGGKYPGIYLYQRVAVYSVLIKNDTCATDRHFMYVSHCSFSHSSCTSIFHAHCLCRFWPKTISNSFVYAQHTVLTSRNSNSKKNTKRNRLHA